MEHEPQSLPPRELVIRVVAMLADANPDGDMFGGFVSPDGTVTSLHTGVNCFFR